MSINGPIVLRSSNIQDGKLCLNDIVRVNNSIPEKLWVEKNDIIICARNGSKKLVGKSAIIPEVSEPMTFGAFMAICKTSLWKYVFCFLQSDLFFSQLRTVSGTTTINQLTQNNFNGFIIPIPPYSEQDRIFEQLNAILRFLAATGARVSELVQLKVEHVNLGYFDIYTKGGKVRRLFIPKTLREEALEWLKASGRGSGYLFLNRFGERITTRGIAQQLKNYAVKYKMNPKVVYPHSFRHRYAKNFLEQYNDIALLADLMGHESIETTRIYLRRTASEQQDIVDKVVVW